MIPAMRATKTRTRRTLAVHMEALGHYFKVMTNMQRGVIQKLEEIVFSERVKKAKKGGNKMKRDNKIKLSRNERRKTLRCF
jgi:hypothetical protein